MNNRKDEIDPHAEDKKALAIINKEFLGRKEKEYLIELAMALTNDLKASYKETKKAINDKNRWQRKYEELENSIKTTSKYSGYNPNKDFIEKLLFILSRNEPRMTFEEIMEAFYTLEPNIDDRWREPNKSISKIISRACKFGAVLRQKKYGEHGDNVYSLSA